MKKNNEIIKMAKYPTWSCRFIFKITFFSLITLISIFFVFNFLEMDIKFRHKAVPTNEIFEKSVISSTKKTIDEYSLIANEKSKILENRLKTKVNNNLIFTTSIDLKKDYSSPNLGFTINFTDSVKSYVNNVFKKDIQVKFFSSNHNGIIISKKVFQDQYASFKNNKVLVSLNGNKAISVDVVGYFVTLDYKSVLFDQVNDFSSSLDYVTFAPIETMNYLKSKSQSKKTMIPSVIYTLDRDIKNDDIIVISNLISNAKFKLLHTNGLLETLSPLIKFIKQSILLFSVTIILIYIIVLILKFKDLSTYIKIQSLFFSTNLRIIYKLLFSNLYISIKSFFLVFLIFQVLSLTVYLITGYYVSLLILFIYCILAIIIINLITLIYLYICLKTMKIKQIQT